MQFKWVPYDVTNMECTMSQRWLIRMGTMSQANPNRYNVTNVGSDSTGRGAAQSVTYFIPMNRLARRSS